LPAFRAAGLTVNALAGRQREKTHRIAYHQDIPFATDDWRALVTHDAVDLVVVATPPDLHVEIAIAALEAGKHVLCEKPMALNLAEAERAYEVACAHPQQLAFVDHELRFHPTFQLGRQIIAQGGIGTFQRAEVRAINSLRINHQTSWDWWSSAGMGGGALGTIGTHQIDMLCYLLQERVQRASGTLRTFITERPLGEPGKITARGSQQIRPVTSDDFANFYLIFPNEAAAVVTTSLVSTVEEPQQVTLYGDEGTLSLVDGHVLYARRGKKLHDITPEPTMSFPEGFSGHPYAHYMQATIYMGLALRAASAYDWLPLEPAATFAQALHTQQVVDAVRKSDAATSSWVPICVP
jgi:predicted dehydrogenase